MRRLAKWRLVTRFLPAPRLARDLGWTPACAASGVAPVCPLKGWVRFVGYNGYPDHGDPAHVGANAHLHLSWLASAPPPAALAPPNTWVRALPVPPTPPGRTR